MRYYINVKTFELSHQKNIRDLGGLVGFKGKKVKSGRLFRGGLIPKVNEEDLKILNSFHLTDIVDFRGSYEFQYKPDIKLEGVRYHNFAPLVENVSDEHKHSEDGNLLWFIEGDKSGFDHMFDVYGELLTIEAGKNAYRKFFELLTSEDDLVVYFHCSQGKDRAGMAAYLLETALGVDEKSKREDYLLSNVAMESKIKSLYPMVANKPYFNEKYKQSFYDVFSARLEYLDNAIKSMEEISGSVLEFIRKELNVDVERLRKIYLEN